jgi:transcriptional antiterminator RfaH
MIFSSPLRNRSLTCAAMSDLSFLHEPGRILTDGDVPAVAWFCLRSQPKHEHIAAEHLRRMGDVEVFNPRMRFQRQTKFGLVEVTESMFPNYLFARFDWQQALARVHYAPGVSGVIHFGSKWPTVPDRAIEEVRAVLAGDGVRTVPLKLGPGDAVDVVEGAFHGLQAIVSQVMPGKQRVVVLMDFLGRQTMVETGLNSVVRNG